MTALVLIHLWTRNRLTSSLQAGSGDPWPVAPDPDDALFRPRVVMTFVIERSRVAVTAEG